MKKCKLLQLRKDAPDRRYKIFSRYSYVVDQYGSVNLGDYEVVWEGSVPDETNFEDVFVMFNMNHPDGYIGRSLSVSDIVEMDGKTMYCDTFGWKEMKL